MAVDKELAMKYFVEHYSTTISSSPSNINSVYYSYYDYIFNLILGDMQSSSTNTFTPEQVAQIEENKNNLITITDDINTLHEKDASQDIKIDDNISAISTHQSDISQLNTEYQDLAQHITEVQQDKANLTEITRLELKIDANTANIGSIAWNPQYHEWQTFLAGLDADGNNNESSDYPVVNEPFNYALNKKYKLLDIDAAGYIMGIKTNLTEERLCFIDKLNTAGDLIRSTQTSDDWVVDVVYDFDTKVTTISVDFLKDTIRDFKLTLMRLEDRVSDAQIAAIKDLINDENDYQTTEQSIIALLESESV